jgi:hypothetical protein
VGGRKARYDNASNVGVAAHGPGSRRIWNTEGETNVTTLATAAVHTMTRLDIATAMAFNDFREAFEQAAPIFDAAAVHEIAARGGSWDEVRSALASTPPTG